MIQCIRTTGPYVESKNKPTDAAAALIPYGQLLTEPFDRLITASILGFVTLTAAFGSSIFSAATLTVAKIFGVSAEVGTLGVSLYVLGFATGPILWAPASELYGRKLPLAIAAFGFSVFAIAVAVGKDLQTVLICRFWNGFFGACPLTVVAAVFSDMFDSRTRGIAVAVFSVTVFSGPLLAPFIGGFIVMSHLGWRWLVTFVNHTRRRCLLDKQDSVLDWHHGVHWIHTYHSFSA